MGQKIFMLEGRQFRTESDYACAKRDKEIIDRLREQTDFGDIGQMEALRRELRGGKYKFQTLLGRDFLDEVEEKLRKRETIAGSRTEKGVSDIQNRSGPFERKRERGRESARFGRQGKGSAAGGRAEIEGKTNASGHGQRSYREKQTVFARDQAAVDQFVQEELKKREKRRKLSLFICSAAAACCLGYFGIYSYYNYRTQSTYEQLSNLKEKAAEAAAFGDTGPLYTLDDDPEAKEVLEEYKKLLNQNKKLIGWVKIDDTNIDYPVMQTTDNEYYLDHNMNQEYDKNGTIFMDKDCDVLRPSTNYILYGHHMKSGQMFGQLDLYKKKSYYEEHPYINFDTIYEKGTYQVMYVFRSKVYKETEIVFKYYQFIDANSEQEFDSYMKDMAELSLYDTGVTAEYGDQLLTLSTCDYQETDGRFVVVAKKIAKE
ncbi:MAG: class B sortase [Lachnospiraceae bacterium]|jgi:SrtB family sortase|nr:class B sortase [Lachnospiraceae bacterium]